MGDVVVASTTDDQASVNAAAGGKEQDTELPPEKPAPTGKPQLENEELPEKVEVEPEKHEEETVPKGVQKRIDKFRAQLTAAQKEIESLKASQPAKAEEKPVVPTEVAAKFDTFDTWSEKQLAAGKSANIDDFLEARDAWKDARRAQQEEQEAIQEQQKEVANAYNERVEAFKAEHDDWDEVVGQSIDLPPGVGPAILELENGPEVAYFLGKNPKAVKELNELSPYAAVAYIGRLSAKLEKPAAEETPTNNTTIRNPDRSPVVSKAPTPISPLKGGSIRPTKDLSDPNIPYDEYRKMRDEQTKARFRR